MDELHEAIQRAFAERGVVTRWALTCEVAAPDGKILSTRSRNAGGVALDPWEEAELHRAAVTLADQDLIDATRPAPDDGGSA